jgi:hypothetical protein
MLYDATPSYVKTDVHGNRYLLLIEKDDFFKPFTRLLGFALTQPNIDFANPITVPEAVLRNGEIFTITRTIRGQAAKGYTFTLGFPAGNWIMTPLGPLTENLNTCRPNFYLVYLCPDEICKGHFWVMPKSIISPLEPGDLMVVGDDATPVEATSQLYTDTPWLYVAVRAVQRQVAEGPLYAVAYYERTCQACSRPNQRGLYAGMSDDETALGMVSLTLDAFATGTDLNIDIDENFPTSTLGDGNAIFVTHSDDLDLDNATTGGVMITKNEGASWVAGIDTSTGLALDMPIAKIIKANSYYWLFGQAGSIYRSADGVNWTLVPQVATTGDLYAAMYDPFSELIYVAGYDTTGTDSVALVIQGTAVRDISAIVNAGALGLYSVRVLSDDHVAFGDVNGNLHEHQHASSSSISNPFSLQVTGAIAKVVGIEGDFARTMIFAGTEIRERSPLTERDFMATTYFAGSDPEGEFTASATGTQYGGPFPGYTYFVGVTDAGEIIEARPCFTFSDN